MKEFTTADHCTVADHICFQVLGHQSFRTGGTGPSDDATPEDPKKSFMDGEGCPKKDALEWNPQSKMDDVWG